VPKLATYGVGSPFGRHKALRTAFPRSSNDQTPEERRITALFTIFVSLLGFRTLGRRALGSVHLPSQIEEAFARTGRLTVSLLPGEADYHLAVRLDSVRLLYVG